MRVLLAVDRVGALPAVQVAAALTQGWAAERPDDELEELALSDGSAGVLDVLPPGGREIVVVPGPLGEPVPASLVRAGRTVWIDADDVLGARLAPGRVAQCLEEGTSAGLGALLAHAAHSGAGRIVVGLGVAGLHDAGAGLLTELGGGPHDVPRAAERLEGLDVVLALAVDEPLTGLHGTGAQLAERHGIDPARAQELDGRTGRAADRILRSAGERRGRTALPLLGHGHAGHEHAGDGTTGEGATASRLTTRTDGGGAGGGTALALLALGARAFDGADVVASELGLGAALDRLAGVGLVVTSAGEVGPDEARRSVMATVGRAAADRALPVVAVGRTVTSSRRELAPAGVSASAALVPGRHPDEPPAADDPAALRSALVDRGTRLARTWSRP